MLHFLPSPLEGSQRARPEYPGGWQAGRILTPAGTAPTAPDSCWPVRHTRQSGRLAGTPLTPTPLPQGERGEIVHHDQPLRYSVLMYCSASGQLVTFRFGPSHSIFLPTRMATLPSRMVSVSRPA